MEKISVEEPVGYPAGSEEPDNRLEPKYPLSPIFPQPIVEGDDAIAWVIGFTMTHKGESYTVTETYECREDEYTKVATEQSCRLLELILKKLILERNVLVRCAKGIDDKLAELAEGE